MPLPDSTFDTTTREAVTEFSVQQPFAPDPNIVVPASLLDADGKVPINAFIRKKVVIQRFYLPPGDVVLVNANGCVLYRVPVICEETSYEYYVTGADALLVRVVVLGRYTAFHFFYQCGAQLTLAQWAQDLDYARDSDGDDTGSRDLLRRMGDPTAAPPSITERGLDPAGDRPAIPYWSLPYEMLRLIAEQGYNTPFQEGDFSVLKETVWQRVTDVPFQVNGCVFAATYRAAVRTTRWRLITGVRFSRSDAIPIEPELRTTFTFEIPGCR